MLISLLLWIALAATLFAFIGRRLYIHPNVMRIVMLAGLGIITGCLITKGGWAWVGVIVTALLCIAIAWASEEGTTDKATAEPDNVHRHTTRPRQATTKDTAVVPHARPEQQLSE